MDTQTWPTDQPPAQEFCDEAGRLKVLASFDAEGLQGDPELARIARFAAQLCQTPSAAISLIEAERQRFIASEGLETAETPRSTSFCAHAMLGGSVLEVQDAEADPRFSDFELVRGAEHLRYYAGAPLISSEGAPMGALYVIDTVPHEQGLDPLQTEGLQVLADAVKRRLEAHRQAHLATFELKESTERLQFMLDSVPDIAWSADPGPVFDRFNAKFEEITGEKPPRNVDDWRKVIHPDDYDASLVKFVEAMTNAAPFEDEWRLKMADGSYRWIVSRAVPSELNPETARWFGTLTDIDDRYRISQEREMLAGELAHRIKNIFAVISGLISLRSRGDNKVREFGESLNENIRALARAHEYALPSSTDERHGLLDLLRALLAPYGSEQSGTFTISGDDIKFASRTATPLALVFHELATNSAKYGALSVSDGSIELSVAVTDDTVFIDWQEHGGPRAGEPDSSGFGSRLIAMAIERQLSGTMTQDWKDTGLHVRIAVPLEQLGE